MNDPDETLRNAVARFRYGLIADVLPLPLGSRDIRRALHQKAQRTYIIPGTRRTRVAVETMRDWLSLYRTGGLEALYPKTAVVFHIPSWDPHGNGSDYSVDGFPGSAPG